MGHDDFVAIISNLSRSMFSVQQLITGLGYLLGIIFIINAFLKFKEAAQASRSHAKLFEPFAYLACGAILLYLPSALKAFSRSLFGSNNILQYSAYNPYDLYSAMQVIIQTAGIIWFVRGAVLLAHSSDPGAQKGSKGEGMKGLAFLSAGILAANFNETIAALDYTMTGLIHWVWK